MPAMACWLAGGAIRTCYEREVSRPCPLAHADLTTLWHTLDQHVPENCGVRDLRHRQPTVLTIEDHTPAQSGFPFAEQPGRLDRFRYHFRL